MFNPPSFFKVAFTLYLQEEMVQVWYAKSRQHPFFCVQFDLNAQQKQLEIRLSEGG
jgi:hypothetical protein